MRAEHSRALLLAETATGIPQSRLEQRLEASTTVISVDADMPQGLLTTRTLLTTLRRGLGRLILVQDGLSPAAIESLERAVADIDPDRPLELSKQTAGE